MRAENKRQKEAFEYYYSLDKRSYERVSKEFGVSLRSVYKWANQYNWQERITQRDLEVSKKFEKKVVTEIVNEKANYRKMVKLAIGKVLNDIRDDKLDYKIQDLDRLIRLDMFLLGESDNKISVSGQVSMSDEDREMVKDLSNNITGLVDELGE